MHTQTYSQNSKKKIVKAAKEEWLPTYRGVSLSWIGALLRNNEGQKMDDIHSAGKKEKKKKTANSYPAKPVLQILLLCLN